MHKPPMLGVNPMSYIREPLGQFKHSQKEPIRTRYLGHVTSITVGPRFSDILGGKGFGHKIGVATKSGSNTSGSDCIRDQYFLIRSVPDSSLMFEFPSAEMGSALTVFSRCNSFFNCLSPMFFLNKLNKSCAPNVSPAVRI
eukprot:sb/3474267/